MAQVGYPGGIFAPFIPGDLAELKVKEIKNGARPMLEAFLGRQGCLGGCRYCIRCVFARLICRCSTHAHLHRY